jgi:cysteinyl-tRNA synthetase
VRQLRIHDTLTGGVVPLEPREPGRVGIYACGPTVYDRVHVGNARPYVVFSLLARFLRREGYEATFVANVTDVNDKIYDAAREQGVPSAELAQEMTAAYVEDTDRLGLGRPSAEPKASETIDRIVSLIEALVDSGHAYEADGDVYFRVGAFPGYGKLSNRPLEDMQQGEGDDAAERKHAPQDFALWKAHKEGEDTSWDSPWGRGRPGWHIECSAMAEAILGLDFEVHGGGSDLVFPHHENEIAQTEAARERPLARVWMHNGMVEMDAAKMAKSEGNIAQLQGALDRFGRDAVVMWLVGGHYRKPLAYSEDALEDAGRAVQRVREFCRRLDPEAPASDDLDARAERFFDALADDFNTPAARAILFDWVTEGNRRLDAGESLGPGRLDEMLDALGLEGLLEPETDDAPEDLVRLARERDEARAARDFERADRLRDQLAEQGWQVRDTPEGARLVRRP